MENNFDKLRKNHFSKPLHLFNYSSAYSGIVSRGFYVQKIQSILDLSNAETFSRQYGCLIFVSDCINDIGMILILKKVDEKYPLFDGFKHRGRGFGYVNN